MARIISSYQSTSPFSKPSTLGVFKNTSSIPGSLNSENKTEAKNIKFNTRVGAG